MHRLVERRAQLAPGTPAIVDGEVEVSYGDLDRRANRLARHLLILGIGPEQRVGVLLGRSADMICALLAVLKAGAAWVPLDPENPTARNEAIARDAALSLLITCRSDFSESAPRGLPTLCVDHDRERIAARSPRAPGLDQVPAQACYVLYTSGSTGAPKGVVVSHRAIAHHTRAVAAAYGLSPSDRVLQFAAVGFDVALEEILPTLAAGAAVVPRRAEWTATPRDFSAAVERLGISVLNLPAGFWHDWVAALDEPVVARHSALRLVVVGSDRVASDSLRRFRRVAGEDVTVVNAYGLTEATVTSTLWYAGGADPGGDWLPLGDTLGGTRLDLLDPESRPVGPGESGQIHLAGPGLARGYLGSPALTAERFLPDPSSPEPGSRRFATGDLARRADDGALELVGRMDEQVKIRGVRVEPAEIEAALLAHPAVREAVVVPQSDSDAGVHLVAWVAVGDAEEEPARSARGERVRDFARRRLHPAMVPRAIVVVASLPRTGAGKIDRAALPEPAGDEVRAAAPTLPRGEVEETLAEIWRDVLGLETVGVEEDFFDLGGHSLTATRVVLEVRERLGVKLSLRALFEQSTITDLARAVAGLDRRAPSKVIEVVPRNGELPLSFAQERLWFLDWLEPSGTAYNLPAVLALRGRLRAGPLERALEALVERHETLRTTFPARDGLPCQRIARNGACDLQRVDLRGLNPVERRAETRRRVEAAALEPFDLARGPLLRTCLLQLASDEHRLLLTLHHIVSDGWSQEILFNELAALYEAFSAGRPSPLAPLPVQYADFSVWQRRHLAGEALEVHLDYWRRQLRDRPALELPTDRPRPPVQTYRGARHCFDLDPALAERVERLGHRRGATLFMTLLAAFQVLLMRTSGQRRFVIGSPIANRTRHEIEGLIGFFVNMLALDADLTDDPSFVRLLDRVRDTALDAYAHQDLPFEELVKYLQPERDPSRHPLFQVTFALQQLETSARPFGDLELAPVPLELHSVRFDLELHMWKSASGLSGAIAYNEDLFEATAVARMASQLERLLAAAVARPEMPISRLPLLSRAERHRLVVEVNDRRAVLPDPAPVHQLVERQAAMTPDALAVLGAGESLTYAELDRRADRVAHRVGELAVGPESRVALLLERSPDLVVALLGTLKAGAGYVPLNPRDPPRRLAAVVRDCRPALIVAAGDGDQHPALPAPTKSIGELCSLAVSALTAKRVAAAAESVAYVLYTSGSTGRPKGVAVTHHALTNHMLWMAQVFPLAGADRVLQKTPVTFDASVWEFWAPLMAGATLVLAEPDEHRDPARLMRTVRRRRITVLQVVPTLLQLLADEPELARSTDLTRLFCGGEELGDDLRRRVAEVRPDLEVVNLYGPTETTIDASYYRSRPDDDPGTTVPIGWPIDNLTLHVVDADLEPVPVGVRGELYIGGAGLARGYFGRPVRTAESFVPDPFGDGGARLYRTGDLVRRRADGAIVFVGRRDDQVKLRGQRVDLTAVEAVIARQPGVAKAVAMVRQGTNGDPRLVAYVVPRDLGSGSENGTRRRIVDRWRELSDALYDGSSASPLTRFDTSGWNSSYTGQPLPEEAMREWLEGTVERIVRLSPRKVFEIGCGTGMVLFRVAPVCDEYLASDFSRTVLRRLRAVVAQVDGHLAHVRLAEAEAADFSGVPDGAFDVVILNSVAQYLPSSRYLLDVLRGAIVACRPGGSIFIGDVRSLPLLDAYLASLELERSQDGDRMEEIERRIRLRRRNEEELVLHPIFFTRLVETQPRVAQVSVELKSGEALNELTRFRYDVTIRLDRAPSAPEDAVRLDWGERGLSVERLEMLLLKERPRALELIAVPNGRLAEANAWRALRAVVDPVARFGDARRELSIAAGVQPARLEEIAARQGYSVELSWASTDQWGVFDARFALESATVWPGVSSVPVADSPAETPSSLAHEPSRVVDRELLARRLRGALEERLPAHQRPSSYVVVERLPLTSSGKVDRRALPEPHDSRPDFLVAYAAPRGVTEQTLAEIWSELLDLERVGRDDDFFELGGHSLLATRVVSRLAGRLGIEIPVLTIFEHSTLARCAAAVDEIGRTDRGSSRSEAIPIVSRDGELPLSFAQRRLWLLEQLDPGNTAYNMPAAFRLRGELDEAALERAFEALLSRHEALRTHFPLRGGRPIQSITSQPPAALATVDLTHLPPAQRQAESRRRRRAEAQKAFDLARGPLVRATLLRLAHDERELLLTIHHGVFDGWSHGIFCRELETLYDSLRRGEDPSLAPLGVQYADFAVWQRGRLTGDQIDAALAYWRRQLADVPALELPSDRPRPPVQTYRGAVHRHDLATDLTDRLEHLGRDRGATLFMTLLAAFQALLYRHSGQSDFAVGAPVANRDRPELEEVIGLFVQTLALRADLSGDPTFELLLDRVRETTLAAYRHRELPFEQLVAELKPRRDPARHPIFQVFFNMTNAPGGDLELPGIEVRSLPPEDEASKFDLVLYCRGGSDGLALDWVWNPDLFDRTRVHRLARSYELLLCDIARRPETRLSRLPIHSAAQRHQVLVEWSGARRAAPPVLVHRLFEDRAALAPDATALVFEDREISYEELNRWATIVAQQLLALGVVNGSVVAICLERGPARVMAILAALKAGAAYLFLDPELPPVRRARQLEETAAEVVITVLALADIFSAANADLLVLDDGSEPARAGDPLHADRRLHPDSLAHLAYTSGSTGRPKAVLAHHRGVADYIRWAIERFELTAADTVLQLAPPHLDGSVRDLLASLVAGARVVLADQEEARDPHSLAEALGRHDVTCLLSFAPSRLRQLLDARPHLPATSLRVLTLVGEALTAADVRGAVALLGSSVRIFNLYGPTECTVTSTLQEVHAENPISRGPTIGRPDPDAPVFLLDADLEPVPIGTPGEIHVGGPQLAHGYLGEARLTAERFVPDPSGSGGRLYRTGDCARYSTDGSLEFLGRTDRQVQVRGLRIEPGEIEAALCEHPDVANAAVVARPDARGVVRLDGYVAAVSSELPASAIREHLRQRLPSHMIPASVTLLDRLPLTAGGKIDRDALPAPDGSRPDLEGRYVAPRDPDETAIADVWRELLALERIGVHDDFFDLGGHSLLATRVLTRLRRTFEIELTLVELFECPTIAELAAVVGEHRRRGASLVRDLQDDFEEGVV